MNNQSISVESIVWLRRDLRLYDHLSFYLALKEIGLIQPVFIFDQTILQRFKNKNDTRISFLLEIIKSLDQKLRAKNGSLIALFGDSTKIIPQLSKLLKINKVFASEDYEPANIKRDQFIKNELNKFKIKFILNNDHLLFSPREILKPDGSPYQLFKPFAKLWQASISPAHFGELHFDDYQRYANYESINSQIKQQNNLITLDLAESNNRLLDQMGYNYSPSSYWDIKDIKDNFNNFFNKKLKSYEIKRNELSLNTTSELSPYLRFGLVSVKDCFRQAIKANNTQRWITELIWRDFFAMILYHYPYFADQEFQVNYRHKLNYQNDSDKIEKFMKAQTGFPIIDAAINQLTSINWMHNRARMITSSFFTKHMLCDWRIGEEFFAQYLIDYELSSNVGNWQWSASVGANACPYFRIFNPNLQSKKFDPNAKYIKKYIPTLKTIQAQWLHEPVKKLQNIYHQPIVDLSMTAAKVKQMFREAKGALNDDLLL